MSDTAPAQLLAVLGRGVVDIAVPLLSADDLGVTRGDGCFDAVRVTYDARGKRAHYLEEHLARLARSAAALQIEAPATASWHELVTTSLAAWNTPGEAILKFVLTRGLESAPSAPVGYLTITQSPDHAAARRGVTAMTLDRGLRSDAFTEAPWLLGGVKTISYAVNVAARREAANRGVDEAIFRSSDGFLLEGPTSGLVIAADDRLWTTPTTGTGVLASVTIAALFAAARQHEVATGEALFTPADAYEADGMWLVSAIRGMLPVVELDGHAIHHDPAVTSVLAKATGFPGIA
ncbi:MAG: aminodeoxychorismate lyase [Propionicimonas sp.]|uniref:aminodeoxychorismate lyase n=1 Tax=Propionicimonas sp. TaxID=1955623 RepID=UPI002B1EC84E|nr:aminodeoxychorismate lyase [Propionicimonas sp.]MEA4944281.1 aminodeoxychorismate lyase [Propionicimonas sp.]MEA5053478.1 aminodeoxychorismate lyase [Propionicimonas sp.]